MNKRNVISAGSGVVVTGLVFLILIPIMVGDFGVERFGFISLMIVLMSTASVFDFGAGRALTYFVSNQKDLDLSIIWSVIFFVFIFAFVIAILFYFLANLYINQLDKVEVYIYQELKDSIPYLALVIPLVILHAMFRGVCDGFGKFGLNSVAKIIAGVTFAVLLLVNRYFEATLLYVSICLICSRLLGILVLTPFVIKKLGRNIKIKHNYYRQIFSFAGLSSLSSLCSTISTYADRFIAGLYIAPIVFGIYSLVSDTIMRFLFIPGAISIVLFPSIASADSDRPTQIKNIRLAYFYLLLLIIPVCAIGILFGSQLFMFWLNKEIDVSFLDPIVTMICLGLFFSCLSQIPFSVIQGIGKVATTAKLHVLFFLVSLPVYVYSAKLFGYEGLLSAWLGRIILEFVIITGIQCYYLKLNEDAT
jgi:O-antigen/teichoic acid export membrane protein